MDQGHEGESESVGVSWAKMHPNPPHPWGVRLQGPFVRGGEGRRNQVRLQLQLNQFGLFIYDYQNYHQEQEAETNGRMLIIACCALHSPQPKKQKGSWLNGRLFSD